MAVRIQMRRGTSSEWNDADPILNEGEIGYNTTLSQLKVGDGSTIWSELTYLATESELNTSLAGYVEITEKGAVNGVAELDANKNVLTRESVIFEGATTNSYQTTLISVDPTDDRTITIPDRTGTIITTGDTGTVTNAMLSGSIANDKLSNSAITINGTSVSLGGTILIPADIEGVTAGTGLTGGGTSGTVTLNVDTTVVATTNNTLTLSNKTIALGSNTVSGTLAEFNSALTDADFATIAGAETLTNKTLTSPSVGTSLTTASTSFDLLNTTATTINLGSAATTLSIGATSGTTTFNNSVTISGDLTVNGTTTTIDTQHLQVEDKNIVLAYGNSTDAGADGGGITLLGATNKTFTWVDATDAWTSSEHMNLVSGKSFKINNTAISAALPGLTWGEVKDGKSGLVIS